MPATCTLLSLGKSINRFHSSSERESSWPRLQMICESTACVFRRVKRARMVLSETPCRLMAECRELDHSAHLLSFVALFSHITAIDRHDLVESGTIEVRGTFDRGVVIRPLPDLWSLCARCSTIG
eukprot:COSAG02_NODE_6401_length_3598_cov_19.791994_1_plen_125_part_00